MAGACFQLTLSESGFVGSAGPDTGAGVEALGVVAAGVSAAPPPQPSRPTSGISTNEEATIEGFAMAQETTTGCHALRSSPCGYFFGGLSAGGLSAGGLSAGSMAGPLS